MRAISSAVALADAVGQKLDIYWIQNSQLNSPFSALFKPIDGVRLIESKRVPLFFRHGHAKNLFIPTLLRTLQGAAFYDTTQLYELTRENYNFQNFESTSHLILTSCVSFFPNPAFNSLFQPVPFIQEQINQETRLFNEYTIGVHIRRSDNKQAIQQSPLALFIDAMNQEITKEPLTNFYVASDDLSVKLTLLTSFGDRIRTHYEPITRTTHQGMQRAVIDLFSLAKTHRVLGSYFSSFSQTACTIGNIPEITIRI